MNTRRHSAIRRAAMAVATGTAIAVPLMATGAPGTLAQAPLFLTASVPPNIFFVLDDSLSMNSEVLKSAGAEAAHPSGTFFDHTVGNYMYPNEANLTNPPQRDDRALELCPGYNVLAYDPQLEYRPWVGENDAGAAYTDRTLATACNDPYISAFCNLDLSGHFYFEWTDSDGDDEYDPGECPRPFPFPANPDEHFSGNSPPLDAAGCAATPGCVAATDPGFDAANYANWYSYYRKREYVVKRTVSQLIDESSVRMGLSSLHNTGSASTPVSDMLTPANKTTLRQNLFLIDSASGGSTPLRRALDQAGKYFDSTDADGHEYLPGAASPILPQADGGHCQQNFTVLLSDGFWNHDYNAGYGNEDNDADAVNPGDLATVWDGGSHADQWIDASGDPTAVGASTLADIAMHYYEKDLSALVDKVASNVSSDDTPNDQQHMVTFTVALGVDGTLTQDPINRTDAFAWPDPIASEAAKVDDMRHAAWNSRGQFLSARRPTEVDEALKGAVAAIVEAAGTASAVTFNTASLSSGTKAFQAKIDSTDWSGQLLAFNIDETDGTVVAPEAWEASSGLDALADHTSRLVLTNSDPDADGDAGATVAWANLTTAQQDDLRTNVSDPSAPMSDAVGQARLAFVLGDRTCEISSAGGCGYDINGDGTTDDGDNSLRDRGSRLGDIVGGAPIVVGKPPFNWPSTSPFPDGTGGTTTYSSFKHGAAATRSEVVYVGSNDGMLHGFQASDGAEVLAYMPSSLFSTGANQGYHNLSDPAYSHRYYVDGPPNYHDVYIAKAAGGTTAWRTLLVAGLGAGGRGIYALDITNPTDFTAANAEDIVLWEFTSADDAELGYTMSTPLVAMMNNGKWAAVVGSGYNDTGADANAHLFIIFLEGFLDPDGDGIWTLDTDYVRLEAPEALATAADRNGLSSPRGADLDGNGTLDRVYVGDLFGNMWAFDLCADSGTGCSSSIADWKTANVGLTPLFTAADGNGKRQPITVRPVISKHPSQLDDGTNRPNVLVAFGTGQYLTTADTVITADVQSAYGVWDHGATSLTRADLQVQTFVAGFNNEVVTDNAVDWTSKHGWYFDFPDAGERLVADPDLRAGILFFNTLVPSGALCTGGGFGYQYSLDLENGGRPDFAIFDYNNNGVVDLADVASDGTDSYFPERVIFNAGIPASSTYLGNKEYTGTSAGTIKVREVFPLDTLDTGRLSWQELTNF